LRLLVVDLQRMPLDVVVALVERPSHEHRKPEKRQGQRIPVQAERPSH
jgi:hypothetical protein